MACHPSEGLLERLRSGREVDAEGEVARFQGSAHLGLSCVSCHPGTRQGPHDEAPTHLACTDCHVVHAGARPHGAAPAGDQLHTRSIPLSPDCQACHGHHQVTRADDPEGHTHWRSVPTLCARCHANPAAPQTVPQVPDYLSSVHGKAALSQGPDRRVAVCTDCHLVHPNGRHTASTIAADRHTLPRTCGRCHPNEAEQYARSIHGRALAAGTEDAPMCTDCHGEHRILSPSDPQSTVSREHIVATCNDCHGNAQFVRLHDLPTARVSTYQESYHGIAGRYGDVEAANCVSCHGAHDILPASDPASHIHPARLAETCASCHPGAGNGSPIGRVHLMPSPAQDRLLFYLRRIYQAFVCLTVLGFLGYIGLDLLTHWRLKRRGVIEDFERRLERLPTPPDEALVRMTRLERWQHHGLIVSFTLLAITGFPLVLPDTLFAKAVMSLCGGEPGRALLHRVGAVALIALTVIHVIWLLTSGRGRDVFRRMLPRVSDIRHAWHTALLFLGRTTHRPCFARYSFLEKFEYWALVWGTIIMGLSGAVMALVNLSLRYLPKWTLDASQILHRWEAILAVIAIVVWHIYHTVWKPDVFPGNRAWLDGKISLEEFVRDHPREYAEAMGWLPDEGGEPDDAAPPPLASGEEDDTA